MKRKSPGYSTGQRLVVTATAQNMTNTSWRQTPNLILTNIGTAVVYISVGATATTTLGYPILPNTQQVITKGHDVDTISVIGSAVGSDLHVMASGEGI